MIYPNYQPRKRNGCLATIVLLTSYLSIWTENSQILYKRRNYCKRYSNAYHLWKFLEKIYEDNSDDEDQEKEEEALEEHTTTATCANPLVTPPEDQGGRATKSAGSQLEPVRPVLVTGQTGLTMGQCKESKKCSGR